MCGFFQGKEVLFDIFENTEDTSCSYDSLPTPFTSQKVKELLLQHSNDAKVRHDLIPEIMDAFFTNNLSEYMEGKSLDDPHRMRGEKTQMDLTQSSILRNVLDRLDDECLIISDRSLDGTINYLKSLIEPNMSQTNALIELRRLQDCRNNLYTQMMIFF